MLWVSSLIRARYERATKTFLAGLGFVAVGVASAITGDLGGIGQRVLGG